MKTIIIITAAGFLVVVLVVIPLVEKTPPPHTDEPWYPTEPIPTLVIPSSGSYAPSRFYAHTGSWGSVKATAGLLD